MTKPSQEDWKRRVLEREKEISRLREDRTKLLEALKPFGAAYSAADDIIEDDEHVAGLITGLGITIADVRRARDLLDELSREERGA